MFVIGVASQAQHGKDTLADRLAQKLNERGGKWGSDSLDDLGVTWQRAAFAANVKKVFCDTFGVDMDFVEKWKVMPEAPPGFDMPVRKALQFIGDGFRKIKSTIWLDLAFRDRSKPKIISDVRYPNEFVRVKKEGGLNILVGRPDKINDDPNGSEAEIKPYVEWCLSSFPTEAKFLTRATMFEVIDGCRHYAPTYRQQPPDWIDQFDIFVRNDGTKEDFFKIIDEQLVPFVEQYVFEFPSEEFQKENKCLISS